MALLSDVRTEDTPQTSANAIAKELNARESQDPQRQALARTDGHPSSAAADHGGGKTVTNLIRLLAEIIAEAAVECEYMGLRGKTRRSPHLVVDRLWSSGRQA